MSFNSYLLQEATLSPNQPNSNSSQQTLSPQRHSSLNPPHVSNQPSPVSASPYLQTTNPPHHISCTTLSQHQTTSNLNSTLSPLNQTQTPNEESQSNSNNLYTCSSLPANANALPPCSKTSLSTYPMVTRSKNGIFKPKQVHLATKFPFPSLVEPTCVTQAMKHLEWKKTMLEELNALIANGTWTLVPSQLNLNVIGNKWDFRLKHNTDGSISRHTACLVAKGYHQRCGIDYHETFSPMVKPQTITLVLCHALSKEIILTIHILHHIGLKRHQLQKAIL